MLTSVQLTSDTLANVYISSSSSAMVSAYLCNTGTSNISVNMYAVESGGTAGATDTNKIYSNLSIAVNDTYVLDVEKLLFDDGEGLVANLATGETGNLSVTLNSTAI